jgi:hypothetical protein
MQSIDGYSRSRFVGFPVPGYRSVLKVTSLTKAITLVCLSSHFLLRFRYGHCLFLQWRTCASSIAMSVPSKTFKVLSMFIKPDVNKMPENINVPLHFQYLIISNTNLAALGTFDVSATVVQLTREWSDPTYRNLPWFFLFTARVHATKSTVKILAANTHCKYFLKIAEHYQYCNLPDPWRNVHP